MLIFGKHPVLEILRSNPESIIKIIVSSRSKIDLFTMSDLHKVKIEYLHGNKFEEFVKKNNIRGNHQGVIALTEGFIYSRTSEILKESSDDSFILILDEIQDPHNFGAVIRTAYAIGADGIITTAKNTVPVTETVVKVSSGAANFIKISRESNIYKTVDVLKLNGYRILGTSAKSDKFLFKSNLKGKIVLIFGSESRGLRKRLSDMCDEQISIPMQNKFNSLNLAVSAGIVLYEVMRQRML